MIYVLVVVAVAVLAVAFVMGRAYFRAKGARAVTCPDNHEPVAVRADPLRAAATALLGGSAVRLHECSRWPEKAGCGQECLREIEASQDGCLVRSILTRWYEGKSCVACGRAIGPIDWAERKPALLGPDRVSVDWEHVAPEKLHEILSTHAPVCFDCHVSETFRRMYPKLVVDRPWDRSGSGASS